MANVEALNDEAIEAVSGGATNTTNPNAGHWQATGYRMGESFTMNGHTWYRIAQGDTLGAIAKKFNTTPEQLQRNNPLTITNISMIYAGDAICIR